MDAIYTLEFHKIRAMLQEMAVISKAAARLGEVVPETDRETVVRLLEETSEARDLGAKEGAPPLVPLGAVEEATRRSRVGSVLSPGELLRIAAVLRTAYAFLRYTDKTDFKVHYPHLARMREGLFTARDLEKKITDSIIDENTISDNASETLFSIRRRQRQTTDKIREILDEIIRSQAYANVLQEQLVTMRGGRYVVPVRAEKRGEMAGVVHDTSQTGSTLFIEPMRVVEANNNLRRLAAEEKEEIQRILAALSAEVAEVAEEVETDFARLVEIDMIFSRARLGDKLSAVCPTITTDGVIDIRRGRHPLIAAEKVVPIDISLGESFDTLVITGPNTGGKTVSLKTLGLLTQMAAAGLHIPAQDGSRIGVFSKIFADIGDEQSIEQSLSTFSAHMVNIVDILKKADMHTLVLLDELGAGTDPGEGAALATTIIKALRQKGAKTAATTHYSEIKMYALSTEGVENAACSFDVETLRPTYRLTIGALGRSNAFAIASQLGMPKDLLEDAKKLVTAEQTKFEDVIENLEQSRRGVEAEREALEADRQKQAHLREQLVRDTEKTESQRQKILDEARREAKRILQAAKAEIDTRIKEATEAENKKKALEKARHSINKKIDSVSEALADNVLKPVRRALSAAEIKAGTPLYLEAMGQRGTALRAPDKDGNVEVQVGIMKVKTHISTVSAAPEEKKPAKNYAARTSGGRAAKQEIDLRGMTLDEAELVTEKFIDDAVLSHLETVTVIHGKGTGVLRSGIQALLKKNRAVKEFRLGRYGEGEDGVTIVTLR